MAAISKISKYFRKVHFDIRCEKIIQIIPEKVFSMLMTSSVTSQRDVNAGLLYSCLNEITTFFTITTKPIDI